MHWGNHKQKKALKKRIAGAMKFLKKTGASKNKKIPSLHSLPYYLLIGPSFSGKTTLLANSELKFILAKKFSSPENINATNDYNWWSTTNAVLIDTPGDNFLSAGKMQKYFLRLLKKHNHHTPPAGILFVFDVDDFLRKSKKLKQIFFEEIKKQLLLLNKIFRAQIPVYLIFNKCDLITGFREYFNDLSRQERQQIWGNSIKTREINHHSFADNFNGIFHKIIRKLNDQLIWRLQHEHNGDKKALINEFPTKMMQLKKPLTQLLNKAFRKLGKNFCPAGIFFTAAIQKNASFFNDEKNIVASNERSMINIHAPNSKSYFTHDLFNNYLFAKKTPNIKTTFSFYKTISRLFLSCFIIAVTALFCIFSWNKFHEKSIILNQAKQIIINNQLAQKKPISLQTLQQIKKSLPKQKYMLPLLYSKNYASLREQIFSLYKEKLNATMLTSIKNTVTKNLRNKSLSNEKLYKNLKIYLELGSRDNCDKTYLKKALPIVLNTTNPTLNDFIDNFDIPLKTDHRLILSVQKKLKRLNKADLSFVILANKIADNQPLSLNFAANAQAGFVFTFADANINIPGIYTAKNFALIYPDLIKQAALEAINGNQIIGHLSANSKNIDAVKITQQLNDKYLSAYAVAWERFINNIKVVNFTSLKNLIAATRLLSSNNSPLLSLAKLIQNNIVPQIAAISPTLKAFSTLANNILEPTASKNIMLSLKNLDDYLRPIATADNQQKQAFVLSSTRMRNSGLTKNDAIEDLLTISKLYPAPIKNWIDTFTANAWHLMLLSSEDYINSIWQKEIVSQYDAQIANRFPFYNSQSDVSLASFSYFFAPYGLIDKFFKNYLDPFVDSTQLPWKLKIVDADSLPIYPSTLADLQKAWQIQRMYFRQSDHALCIAFSIQPLAIKYNTQNFAIILGSQQQIYGHGKLYTKDQFVWPDDINSNIAKFIFTDTQNQQITMEEHGPWSWFKLLGSTKTNYDKNHNKILISKNDLAAKIDLITTQQNNPFSLNLLKKFKLPHEL